MCLACALSVRRQYMTARKSFVIEEIQALLDLFHDVVPDKDSNRLVWMFCDEKHRWPKAHGLFQTIRDRTLAAERRNDQPKLCQYLFEEVVAKTLYNLSRSSAPFDPDSPYWVIKNALRLARELHVPLEKVTEIVA